MMNQPGWEHALQKVVLNLLTLFGFRELRLAKTGNGDDPSTFVVPLEEREYPRLPMLWCYAETVNGIERFQCLPWGGELSLDNSFHSIEVVTGYLPFTNIRRILWITDAGYAFFGSTPRQVGIQAAAAVTADRFVENGMYIVSGYTVGMRAGSWRVGNDFIFNTENNVAFDDLSAYLPAFGGFDRWVMIGVDTSAEAVIISGEEFESDHEFPAAFIPTEIPAEVRIGARVRLRHGAATPVEFIPVADIWNVPALPTFLDADFTIQDNGNTTRAFQFQASGITAGQTRIYTVPNYDATLATLAGTETFTNKTLTSPVINGITNGTGLAAGTYTPTLTNVANLDASTAYQCQYMRVGNIVTVSGRVDVDPALTTTATQLGISLPIPSNLGAAEDCSGCAFASGIAGQGAAILGDATNDRAQMEWIAGDVTNQAMYFTFTYEVI